MFTWVTQMRIAAVALFLTVALRVVGNLRPTIRLHGLLSCRRVDWHARLDCCGPTARREEEPDWWSARELRVTAERGAFPVGSVTREHYDIHVVLADDRHFLYLHSFDGFVVAEGRHLPMRYLALSNREIATTNILTILETPDQ